MTSKTFFINSVRFWKCAFIYSFLISTYTLINHLYPEKCTRVYAPKSAIQAIINNCNQQSKYCYVISYPCPRWPVAYSLHDNLSYDIIIYFNFTTWFPGVKDPDVCIIKNRVPKPVAQIPHRTSPISYNAPFCHRNVHMCAHFCYKIAPCRIFVWCIMGFFRWLIYYIITDELFNDNCCCKSILAVLDCRLFSQTISWTKADPLSIGL